MVQNPKIGGEYWVYRDGKACRVRVIEIAHNKDVRVEYIDYNYFNDEFPDNWITKELVFKTAAETLNNQKEYLQNMINEWEHDIQELNQSIEIRTTRIKEYVTKIKELDKQIERDLCK